MLFGPRCRSFVFWIWLSYQGEGPDETDMLEYDEIMKDAPSEFEEEPRARRRLQKAAAADALRRNFTTFVKQLSGTYSILVNLPWVLDIKFPDLYERVLNYLALVNVDFSFSVECVMSRKVTFQDRLLAATIGPVAGILMVITSVRISRHSSATPSTRRRRRET